MIQRVLYKRAVTFGTGRRVRHGAWNFKEPLSSEPSSLYVYESSIADVAHLFIRFLALDDRQYHVATGRESPRARDYWWKWINVCLTCGHRARTAPPELDYKDLDLDSINQWSVMPSIYLNVACVSLLSEWVRIHIGHCFFPDFLRSVTVKSIFVFKILGVLTI